MVGKAVARKLLSDLRDPETTRICSAPIEEDQYLEGIYVERGKCILAYDESTRNDILDIAEETPCKWLHFSGGFRNSMTAEFKFFRDLPGNVPFNERKVRDYKQHLPIEFAYLENWVFLSFQFILQIWKMVKWMNILKITNELVHSYKDDSEAYKIQQISSDLLVALEEEKLKYQSKR